MSEAWLVVLGAVVALVTTVVTEVLRVWLGRWQRIKDAKSTLQFRTAEELQEVLFEAAREASQVYLHDQKSKDAGRQSRTLIADDLDVAIRLTTVRLNMLSARIEDKNVRNLVEKYGDTRAEMFTASNISLAEKQFNELIDQIPSVNQALGVLMRGSLPTPD